MLYIVFFEDVPTGAEIRAKAMPAHLAFLAAHSAEIRAAGPLAEAGAPAGGLWLVEADAQEDVVDLTHRDPFFAAGLRQSIRVLAWTNVAGSAATFGAAQEAE